MKKWFGDITLNTIFRMVVGKRFSTAFDGLVPVSVVVGFGRPPEGDEEDSETNRRGV